MSKYVNYITELFNKMDLQHIREFMIYGTKAQEIEIESFDERLKIGGDPIYNRLRSLYQDSSEFDKAASDLSQALAAHDAVYMEIGMRAGARLVYQLLLSDNPAPLTERGAL